MLTALDQDIAVYSGSDCLLAHQAEFDALRDLTGVCGDAQTDLHRFLSWHDEVERKPVMVLLGEPGKHWAAVFASERCIHGIRTGVLRIGDATGSMALIAPEPLRQTALERACQALLQRFRPHTIIATLQNGPSFFPELPAFQRMVRRSASYRLPLCPELDQTLQRFPKKKQKNLLYYRRRLMKEQDLEFVPSITPDETEDAMVALSAHARPSWTAAQATHYRKFLQQTPAAFTMGIRVRSGTWLALTSGWRQSGTSYLPWQMNHSGYKRESLMQVLRVFLMEHEGQLGQSAIEWLGGTVAMQTACEPLECTDFLAYKPGLRSFLLSKVAIPFLIRQNSRLVFDGSMTLLAGDHAFQSTSFLQANHAEEEMV